MPWSYIYLSRGQVGHVRGTSTELRQFPTQLRPCLRTGGCICARRSLKCRAEAPMKSKTIQEFDISPYLLWSKTVRLTAYWDAAATDKEYLQHMEKQLQLQNADNVQFFEMASPTGRRTISLSLMCHPRFMEEMSATMLQMTPATEVQATKGEMCSLPQYTTSIETQYGAITVTLSLAGSTAYKATPCWRACEEAAAKAGNPDITTEVVVQAVLQHLQQGLEDGTIDLLALMA